MMASTRVPLYILRAPPQLRPLLFSRYASHSTASAIAEHVPRIAQPSLWRSLIPRFMRRDAGMASKEPKSQGFWSRFLANPASGVIILAMLTGNAAIHIIRIKRDMNLYSRQADQKIELLREVINRVQRGEDVNVEKLLGTGDPKMEEEWFDVIREIEKEEKMMTRNERQRLRRQARKEEEKKEEAEVNEREAKDDDNAQVKKRPEFL
ncbi:hypothetical protein, variant 3 [Verruconis gallopava]|uniref:Uncharacterized protein n=1 Tax=Verruconis gallopava TaxID=253628 RepID=A0A0D2A0F4_9PEZI|nr:hypothetical protein, variant 1 [Verruconis gallopava]XP_016209981.1 hypothetical protein, variant 2 [Verruconis gallopava]XP_016209982.1 hypothetical protein, variant 3 [Verruconis gallopava]KIW00111.1 hypothetical protein, variant 1 [Verruconis gallopava]KIW00112.1 hypothetical protein, variant 2 [Verruconis gallopava]KIW00113.1 hypothetical protein, variant 3 [Verruconis gallopava]